MTQRRHGVAHRYLLRSLGVICAFAVLVAACGDDDDGVEAASSPATEESTGTEPAEPEAEPADDEATSSEPAAQEPADEAPSEEAETEEEPSTRTVETPLGPVEIPGDPQRVIALDEYSAMNLLAVGITPMEVTGSYASLVSQEILADSGVTIVEQADAFALNFEAIAAATPDLIVVTAESAFMGEVENLTAIAPTIVLPYTEPWRNVIADTGDLFGRADEAAQVTAALESRLAEVTATVAADPFSLSILGDTFGIVFAVSPEAVLSAIVAEVGIDRPAAELDGEPMAGIESVIAISTEVLDQHEADIIAVMTGVYYEEATFLDAPTYQDLAAVQAGNGVVVDGDMWFGTHPFAIYWILEDIAGLARGEGAAAIGDLDDIDDRWAGYLELVG